MLAAARPGVLLALTADYLRAHNYLLHTVACGENLAYP
ncbi:MAG: hypothetical protein RL475_866 [Actinomycetota bacterium]|jgi:hypothetical protein